MLSPAGPWKKSSFCGESGCVEVAVSPTGVHVRDSKQERASDSVLQFTADEWRAFVAGVKSGEFDLA